VHAHHVVLPTTEHYQTDVASAAQATMITVCQCVPLATTLVLVVQEVVLQTASSVEAASNEATTLWRRAAIAYRVTSIRISQHASLAIDHALRVLVRTPQPASHVNLRTFEN
jgi:hypothetical protein